MRRLIAALAAPLLVSVGLHLLLLWSLPRLGPSRQAARPREVKMVVTRSERPPPPEPPREPEPPPAPEPTAAPPPPQATPAVRPARTPVPEPPEPPQGFSLDEGRTVAEGEGLALPAREGGGNMFADPNAGRALGERRSSPLAEPPPTPPPPPPPPPPPAKLEPPEWITPVAERSPPYPRSAKLAEVEGQVLLRVCVDPDGAVETVEILRGLGAGCDEAAVAWAKQKWRFRPARQGQRTVSMCVRQSVRFELRR